jgi:hypothetical protein
VPPQGPLHMPSQEHRVRHSTLLRLRQPMPVVGLASKARPFNSHAPRGLHHLSHSEQASPARPGTKTPRVCHSHYANHCADLLYQQPSLSYMECWATPPTHSVLHAASALCDCGSSFPSRTVQECQPLTPAVRMCWEAVACLKVAYNESQSLPTCLLQPTPTSAVVLDLRDMRHDRQPHRQPHDRQSSGNCAYSDSGTKASCIQLC